MTSTPGPREPGRPQNIRDGDGFLYVDRELLVNAADVPLVADELARLGAVRQDVQPTLGRYLALYRLPREVDIPDLVERLRSGDKRPRVGPNHVLWGETSPGLILIGQPKYHGGPAEPPSPAPALQPKVPPGNARVVKVAIIDTGVATAAWTLPLLRGRSAPNLNEPDGVYVGGVPPQIDVMGGHGTMVAGLVALLARRAVLMSVQVLGPTGTATELDLVAGIERAVAAGAEILNISLGGSAQPGQPPTGIDAVLTNLADSISVVAAAGNTWKPDPNFYPARHDRVVSVAALDTTQPNDPPASFSNSGSWVKACAPGVRIHSTYVTGTWDHGGLGAQQFPTAHAAWSGTSFAAPIVTGVIAASVILGQSAHEAEKLLLPTWSPVQDHGARCVPPVNVVYP